MYEYIPWVARDGVRGERTCGPSTPSLEFVGPALFTSQLTPRRDLAMRLHLRACINVLNTPSQKTTTRYTYGSSPTVQYGNSMYIGQTARTRAGNHDKR